MSKFHNRNASTIPTVNVFNNWFSQHQEKSSILSVQSRGMTPNKYSSTIGVNPEASQFNESKNGEYRLRRTHSAFRNNQSRVSTMRDGVFDLGQQIKHLQQKTKGSKLQLDMMKKDLTEELKDREASMKSQLSRLNKLVKQTIKMDQIRTDQIKHDTMGLRQGYESLKHTVYELQNRLSAVEHECGFMTFASKLYK